MPTIFSGHCWRCWPNFCKCPPAPDEIESMKSDTFLLDSELLRENRRAREFHSQATSLASAILSARDARLANGGLDNLPPDLFDLSVAADRAMDVLAEHRNEDRVSALYTALASQKEKNDAN